MQAVLTLSAWDFDKWAREKATLADAYKQLEPVRRAVSSSTNYVGGSHADVWFSDKCGELVLLLCFASEKHFAVYARHGCRSLLNMNRLPTSQELEQWAEHVRAGQHFCDKCETWNPLAEFKHYSFAGMVCADCYDPAKHTGPDTRGD
jgi:hypothetical protein